MRPFKSRTSRRQVLRVTGAATLGSLSACAIGAKQPAGGREMIRVGLVGCGGRGGGAAVQALRADPNVKLVALGDVFADQLNARHEQLLATPDVADRVDVPEERKYVGFDAYKKVIEQVDVVLLTTSPHFRPLHVEYAVEHDVHCFVEKPVATDGPGLRRMRAACDKAAEKGLSILSGLCYRYEFGKQALVDRIHGGEIGDIRSMQCTYNTGGLWHRGHKPEWSDMEYQMRNWLYFSWLSGDHIAEQHIHSLDKLAWAMGDKYPVKATASGGRSVRTDEKYGDVFDHFQTVYEWEDGTRGFASCRQWVGADSDVSDYIVGTKGTAEMQRRTITPIEGKRWRHRSDEPDDMYQNEHNVLFEALRNGERIDNSNYMIESTLMALMGRLSAYTGKSLTREQVLNSTVDLTPKAYEWGDAPAVEIAVPGVTPFA
ncbi:MAG: putative dehydrogenase [Planctomycetota bacterium]|jgi:predicted dehydrogenase